MNHTSSSSFYFWCCIAQSLLIVALALYIGQVKQEKETAVKEKEIASFSLMLREAEMTKLKAIVDTCHAEKK